jgi:hypothetical protein
MFVPHLDPGLAERDQHRFLVHRFEKPVPQLVVHLVENANDPLGQLAMFEVAGHVAPPVVNRVRVRAAEGFAADKRR